MSVKIHHGPHGSYKTSGGVKDDLIPAIKEGRPIVTNLRGITLERIHDAIPDAPDSVELFHVDTDTQAGLDRMRRFFHWVPENAFIFIDEAQIVFPKSWREADLRALDHPDGLDACFARNRPPTWEHAWDMERHFNFDMVLTTPNIKKIRDDIRTNAESAFKHKNNGIYGSIFKGSYIEGFHFADDNGTAQSDFQSIVKKRIKPNDPTWRLYDSTKTGQHRDTKAGINLLASPRVLLPLGVITIAAIFAFSNGAPPVLGGGKPVPASVEPAQTVRPVSVRHGTVPAGRDDLHSLADFQTHVIEPAPEKLHPFEGSNFRFVGLIESKKGRQAYFEIDGVFITQNELQDIGYTFTFINGCAMAVHHGRSHLLATCNVVSEKRSPESDRGAAGVPSIPPLNVADMPNGLPASPESLDKPAGAI